MSRYSLSHLEFDELLQRLRDHGRGDIVDALYDGGDNDMAVYTRGGRINKSAVARVLGTKPTQVDTLLSECREILGADLFD